MALLVKLDFRFSLLCLTMMSKIVMSMPIVTWLFAMVNAYPFVMLENGESLFIHLIWLYMNYNNLNNKNFRRSLGRTNRSKRSWFSDMNNAKNSEAFSISTMFRIGKTKESRRIFDRIQRIFGLSRGWDFLKTFHHWERSF